MKMNNFPCQKCPRTYDTWRQLTRHNRDKHSERKVKCPNADLGCTYEVTVSKRERMRGHVNSCRYDPATGGPKPRPKSPKRSKSPRSSSSTSSGNSKPRTAPSHTAVKPDERHLATPQYEAGSNGLPELLCDRPWSPVTIITRAPTVASSGVPDLFSPPRKVIRREDPLPSPSSKTKNKMGQPSLLDPASNPTVHLPLSDVAPESIQMSPPSVAKQDDDQRLHTPIIALPPEAVLPLTSAGILPPLLSMPQLISPLPEDKNSPDQRKAVSLEPSASGDATCDNSGEVPPKTPNLDASLIGHSIEPGETISLRPYHQLRHIDANNGTSNGATYDYLVSDPRLFFLGAPSSYSESVQANFLRNVREAAVHVPTRYAVKFWPPELSHIKKEESAVLPDGTIYKLANFWFKKEVSLCNAGTQTTLQTNIETNSDGNGPTSRDQSVQVEMVMRWAIPDEE